jgi:hypothetical protein
LEQHLEDRNAVSVDILSTIGDGWTYVRLHTRHQDTSYIWQMKEKGEDNSLEKPGAAVNFQLAMVDPS